MERVTVFTPTYNRANVLCRVYDSLVKQTYRDFHWLIVDDGSQDNTKEVVDGYIAEGKMAISYYYQENQGKHTAINNAVAHTDSELFLIADSDDAFTANALERLVEAWDSIPQEQKNAYMGVVCRCFDSETGKPIGEYPKKSFDSNHLDAVYKMGLKFEKWMLFRTDVLREFPFPKTEKGLKFYPETIVWQQMARKYQARYIDDALREYFRDQENALTHVKMPRFRENVHLWAFRVNDTMDYFWYAPMEYIKSFVGLCRDNIVIGKRFKEIVAIPNKTWKKVVAVAAYPVGWLLGRKYTRFQDGR